MSGYMMYVTDEGRNAIAWVREHGGLDHVRAEWRSRIPYDRYEAQVAWNRVAGVCLDIKHFLDNHENAGVRDMEMWIRSLRDALKSDASDCSDSQNPSCAGAAQTAGVTSDAPKVTREDVEAAAWVREHGGIAYVKDAWNVRSNLDRQLERAQAKVERQQRHIEFVQGKCRERLERIAALNKTVAEMRPRLMPEGMEWLVDAWPRFEDDAPLKLGDMALIDGVADMVEAVQLWIHGKPVIYGDGGSQQLERGERVNRPAPKDSWERLEKDACKGVCDYFHAYECDECEHAEGGCCKNMARDLVRRCRALAERERGE